MKESKKLSNIKSFNLYFLCIILFIFISPVYSQPFSDENSFYIDEFAGSEETDQFEELSDTEETEIFDVLTDTEETQWLEVLAIIEDDEQFEEIVNEEDSLFTDEYFEYLFFEYAGIIIEGSSNIQTRTFDDIFPDISRARKRNVMSGTGLRNTFESHESPLLIPSPDSGIDLLRAVRQKDPSHIIETAFVFPYSDRELDMLDIFNALRRIEDIKDQTVVLNNGSPYNVFTDTTRIESAQQRRVIPDPEPALELPYSETMYLRFTDTSIGNLFLRADISFSLYGVTYNLTNFRDVYYSIFRIMRAERVSIIIYLEPIKEGILIYSVSGMYLPGFIANRIDLTPTINRRISTLMGWITDGLRKQGKQPNRRIESVQEEDTTDILQGGRFGRIIEN